MNLRRLARWAIWSTLTVGALVLGHPFPGTWDNGLGAAVHFQPVQWPAGPATPALCGASCGDWKPYTRFSRGLTDARVQDPSNGGTAPQNYVNVASSCTDKSKPSIYYYLHKASNPVNDVVMFRWRVEAPAHNYATGSNAGSYGATNPWNSAQWTVLFNIDGSGYRSLAAHLNGSSGSPAEPVDMLAGIWSNTTDQTIDYTQPNVHLLAHNPTAFVGSTGKLLNFHGTLTPNETWANGSAETEWDYGTTRATLVTNSPCTEYFIDYQIPVAMLDASGVGGPSLTRDTPISMLFCTANSLSNPFQKDCALNKTWNATSTQPAPFGDYLSFNKDEPYQQPIISSVTATAPTSCPGSYTLTTKIQDVLAVQNGVVVNTLKSVQFYYWYDRNGDGAATAADTGSQWTRITPAATLAANSLNTFTASWNATTLPKGKYLVGVQAVDDNTVLDDGMTATGIDNRTFSYLSGDTDNEIYISGVWVTGQQAGFPSHSPSQSPVGSENWYGNPSVTGMQVALVGTAINACGVAPTITLGATPSSVAAGGTVGYTMTVTNPGTNSSAITVSSVGATLPTGFTYTNGTSSGTNGLPSTNPSLSSQQLTWTLGSPITLNPGASAALGFSATAASAAGSYSATAVSTTSFGDLTSSPASTIVDTARVSLTMTPSAYSIAANGSTTLTYTLRYANDSGVIVTGASISNVLPAGVTYSACSGGTSCGNTAGTVSWSIGSLGAGASGTATLTITVPSNYSSFSLTNSATLSATAPDASTVSSTASTTVAVTGVSLPGTPTFKLANVASVTSVAPSGSVTYTLTYTNDGTASASSVVITDTLASGTTYSSNTGGGSHSSGVVTWNIGSVAAGASASVTVTVAVAGPTFSATNPTTNTASIAWTGGTPVTASAIVGVTGQSCSSYYFKPTTANVGFDGTKNIAVVSPVTVSGDTGAKVSATVTSSGYTEMLRFYQDPQTPNDVTFSGNLTTNIYIDRNNGQGMDIRSTVYDYNSTTGAKTSLGSNVTSFNGSTKGLLSFTLPLSGTLSKGHRLMWLYEATASNNPVPVEFQYGGTVTNGYSSGSTAAISYANYCVTPPANLTLTNTVSSASVTENTTPVLTYTLRYANTGSSSAANSVLVGALPTGFAGCQYSTDNSSWNSCSSAGGSPPSHSFSIGSIAGGASGTVYVRGTVPAGTTSGSSLVATSSISSDQTSSVSATATTAIGSAAAVATPALALSLAANRSTAGPGNSVVYTVTVVNTGSAAASNVVVSNTVPANGYYTYSSCTGSCGAVGNVLTWPTIATLAAGASQSYTYTMGVATSGLPSGVTSIADTVQASGDSGLSATSNSVAVEINGNPSLVLLNNAAPSSGLLPGSTITYTLTLGNSGSSSANAVVVTNPIPANTAYLGSITASQGTGNFDTVNNRVVFNVGTLASGASATLTFAVAVNSPLPSGPTTITSTATADSSNAAQQVASAGASASATPVLAISKSAPSSVAYPSALLTAAASGTTIFVDRTDHLNVNQLIKIGSQVARIVSLGAKSLTLDSSITATSGAAVNGSLEFTIAYGNTGNANATGVTVTEVLDTGFGYHSSSPAATMAPVSGSSGTVSWTIGTLAAGSSSTVQIVAFPLSVGSFTNTSSVSASNATTASTTSTTRIGGLSVVKSSSTPVVSAGATASYAIVVSNSLVAPVSSVTVTDKLPQGFTYDTGSALVGGAAVEPTFAVDDTAHAQPSWSALTVPANGSLTITFVAQVAGTTGAGVYQNELEIDAPGGTGVSSFDPLLTTNEDVNVLAAATGMVKGYVFKRPSGNALSFDPVSDTPLSGVRVEIHKNGADCNNPVGNNCVVVYTDSNGYFERAMAAEPWIVSVKENTGDLPTGWFQLAGANDDTVSVPDQGVVWDYNGFTNVAPTTHTVTASAGSNGTIAPGSRSVIDGNTTTFAVTPDSGYFINTVTGCGGSLSSNTYTTGVITGSCTVNATFSAVPPVTHTVNTSAGAGGGISPGSAIVTNGNTTSFTVTPNSGFSINTVTGCGGNLSGNTYTTGAITGACTVSATFSANAPVTHLVGTSAGSGGSISPNSATVNDGATTAFTVTPDSGFAIASVTGCSGNLSGNTYTTGAITGACTVSATFSVVAPVTHLVSTSAGTGGSIGPASAIVTNGNTTSFTVTPSSGYGIASVTGCGGGLSGNTYTTGAITAACTVSASFALNTYTVTSSAGAGGSIGPGSATVNHNQTTSFTVTPNTGYGIASVTGCGGSLSGNTYTTGPVTGACAVNATFSTNSHTVTATAGSGGTISPGSASVTHNQTTSFTVTPNTGYEVSSVTGCGGTLSNSTYTTAPVTGACAVTASFSIKTYTVSAVSGAGGSISPASRTVNHDETTTFTVTPDQSFAISSVTGCGGSLAGNTYTTGAITAACTVSASFVQHGPRFDPAAPASINARALLTDVPLTIAPRAIDGNGVTLTVTLVGEPKLRPGRHLITWRAVDAQGRAMTQEQQLDIWPMVTVSEDIVVGFGNVGEFRIQLNGDSPVYPFSAPFTVGGDGGLGTLHNLAPRSVTFVSGTEQTVQFAALAQGTSMPTRHLQVALDPSLNIGARSSLDIALISENFAPQVQVRVTQANRIGTLVTKDGGPIVLHATVDDPNVRDAHTLEWTPPRGAITQVSANGLDLTVDPQSLSSGVVEIGVSVVDNGTPQMSGRNKVALAVRSASLQLDGTDTDGDGTPDIVEGWADSGNGIPQYLARPLPRSVLPEDVDVTDRYLVEGDSNVQLRIGAYSQLTSRGVRLTSAQVASLMGADQVSNVGGIFDVEAVELGATGAQVRVVIPQRQPVPTQPIYRLWDASQSSWTTFIENGTNRLSSAPGEAGYCPPAGSSAYTPGLTAGHWCVQVTIEDGGANDADRITNAALGFSGGIGQRTTSIVTGTSSGGGGGSMGMFTGMLCVLALLRKFVATRTRTASLVVAGALIGVSAHAADKNDDPERCADELRHCYYLGATLGLVRNSDGAAEMDSRLRAQGYTTSTSLSGQSRMGFGVFGGYRWERLAAELSYAHLGRMDTIVAGNTPVDTTYLRAVSAAHPRSGEGPQLSAIYHLPLNEKFEAFGRGGLFYWKNTLSAEGFGQYADVEGRKFDLFFGLGIQWHKPEKKWALKGELQGYKLDGETVLMIAADFSYRVRFRRE